MSPKVDFAELARKFEFSSGSISSATVRAAAKVRGGGQILKKSHKFNTITCCILKYFHIFFIF